MKKQFEKALTYGLYPALLVFVFTIIYLSIRYRYNFQLVNAATIVFLIMVLIAVESYFPLSKEWKMTKRNFWRDIKYILIDAPVLAVTNMAFGSIAVYYSQTHKGYLSSQPLLLSVVGYLLFFEFFQYWYHRLSHTGKGEIGRFFWKVHVAHHLPDKVYVIMHAVFNPLNGFIAAIIIQAPLLILGISPEAVLTATLLIALQGVVSHFNANIKAGWLNYIFIGTETHRYHHSANLDEAKNYGVTLAFWDIVFGTFYYKPDRLPKKIGVSNPNEYPSPENILEVIKLPFKKKL
jgi:sterol desaturase/sphingolipid hydroxylase (fatty acid hydroxylase superfamily)